MKKSCFCTLILRYRNCQSHFYQTKYQYIAYSKHLIRDDFKTQPLLDRWFCPLPAGFYCSKQWQMAGTRLEWPVRFWSRPLDTTVIPIIDKVYFRSQLHIPYNKIKSTNQKGMLSHRLNWTGDTNSKVYLLILTTWTSFLDWCKCLKLTFGTFMHWSFLTETFDLFYG